MAKMYHCSNCREDLDSVDKVRKTNIGEDRNLVFCKACNCYLKIEEPIKKPQASNPTSAQ